MMFKRHTTNARQKSRMRRLEVRVMSPRIAWFSFLKTCGKGVKLAFVLALLAGVGWGIWQGVQRAFYKNPEFQLRRLVLNPNHALDEAELAQAAGIDLSANLFTLDPGEIQARLAARPEVASVSVERQLPSTLAVTLYARVPRVWVAITGSDPGSARREGGLLVDDGGMVYPCPRQQWESARDLPVVLLPVPKEGEDYGSGKSLKECPQLRKCLALLDAASTADSSAPGWIDHLEQTNIWSIRLTTRTGTAATFGLENQARQMADFVAALEHATGRGYGIATISLIPQRNIPITLREEPAPPRAIPVREPAPEEIRGDRRSRDLRALLDRN